MQLVSLRNGAQEDVAIVRMKMATLHSLATNHPTAFRELVLMCRAHNTDASHAVPNGAAEVLTKKGVLWDGSVQRAMLNVVLSAAQPKGSDFVLTPPYDF
jgi:hypothetical protein